MEIELITFWRLKLRSFPLYGSSNASCTVIIFFHEIKICVTEPQKRNMAAPCHLLRSIGSKVLVYSRIVRETRPTGTKKYQEFSQLHRPRLMCLVWEESSGFSLFKRWSCLLMSCHSESGPVLWAVTIIIPLKKKNLDSISKRVNVRNPSSIRAKHLRISRVFCDFNRHLCNTD